MKIGVLSDIHGNYTAFKAVLEDAKKNNVSKYIIAGDHIGDGPQPLEVVSEIMRMNDCCVIKGNKEQKILGYYFGNFPDWKDCLQTAVMVWTSNKLMKDQIKYLESLPIQDSYSIDEKVHVRVVHGSINSANEKIDEDDGTMIKEILDTIDEQVLIFGHSHLTKRIDYKGKIAINPGSVGLPFNELAYAEYGILDWNEDSWIFEQRYVNYNKDELKKQFMNTDLIKTCGAWAKGTLQAMLQGKNIALEFLHEAYRISRERGYDSYLVPNEIWVELDEKWNWEIQWI